MINDNLYDSLSSIITESNVDIYSYLQVFTYGSDKNPITTSDNDILTYREESKVIWGKGKKYIKEVSPEVFNYFYETKYKVNVRLEAFGENAEDIISRIIEVLNNNEDNFYNNSLAVLDYGDLENLTSLENSEYKERFALNILFEYNLERQVESADLIKTAEFDLINRS